MGKKKLLYVKNGDFTKGGVESFILNYYPFLIKNDFQVDFLIHTDQHAVEDNDVRYLKEMGSEFFYVPTRTNNLFKHISRVDNLLKSREYDIIHTHTGPSAALTLLQAKKYNILIRIAHSHGTNPYKSNLYSTAKDKVISYITKFELRYINRIATDYVACSLDAGEYLFGKDKLEDVEFIYNAIDIEKFKFSEGNRLIIRKTLNIEKDENIIGQIGRLDDNKNQIFTIELFEKIIQKNPNAHLLIVGTGSNFDSLTRYINEKEINNVHMIGESDEIEKYMSAMDVLLLPSYHEGLPLVPIEAQANGLPVISSDSVSSEIEITNIANRLSLDEPTQWLKKIDTVLSEKEIDRLAYNDIVKLSKYNIFTSGPKLIEYYHNLLHNLDTFDE